MPLPVIPDVFRVTWNWTAQSAVTPHNVMHVLSASADEALIAASLMDNLTTNMIALLQDEQTLETMDIIKLDGTSAQQTFTSTTDVDGQGTGDAIPAQAGVLSMHSAQRGPRGRGRLYIGPVHESHSAGGMITPSDLPAAIALAWTNFAAAIEPDDISICVASYVHSDAHVVTTFSMRSALGTMRRRQDQLVA